MANVPMDFWKGKRVFITGHTGFKGIWLSLWLQSLGATVFGYSTSAAHPADKHKLAVPMESTQGDICDADAVCSAMQRAVPHAVFHMAAQPLVRRAFHDPLDTYRTNVLGTAAVMAAVRQCTSVRSVIVVTTDKCYENQQWDWAYRESDRLGGADPYSSSKACMELVVQSFRDSFFSSSAPHPVGIATARAGNMLGGGDWAADRLLPDMMRNLAVGQPVSLRNPAALRPWQYVLDTLRGYLLLTEALHADPARYSGAWNFGPAATDIRSVQWIAEHVTRAWGSGAQWNVQPGTLPQESQMTRLDCSKAEKELGWSPVLSLAEALEQTVDWYRCFYSGGDVRSQYMRQIRHYLRIVAERAPVLSESACAG